MPSFQSSSPCRVISIDFMTLFCELISGMFSYELHVVRLRGRTDGHASRLSATRIASLRGGCCSNRVPSRCYRWNVICGPRALNNSLMLLPHCNRSLWACYPWILFYVFSWSPDRAYILRLYYQGKRCTVKLSGNIWRAVTWDNNWIAYFST